MDAQPFNPTYASGQTVTPAASSAAAADLQPGRQVCLTNLGTNVCYVRIGAAAAAATAADYPVPPGSQVTITKDHDHTKCATISPLGTTLHIMVGLGL